MWKKEKEKKKNQSIFEEIVSIINLLQTYVYYPRGQSSCSHARMNRKLQSKRKFVLFHNVKRSGARINVFLNIFLKVVEQNLYFCGQRQSQCGFRNTNIKKKIKRARNEIFVSKKKKICTNLSIMNRNMRLYRERKLTVKLHVLLAVTNVRGWWFFNLRQLEFHQMLPHHQISGYSLITPLHP